MESKAMLIALPNRETSLFVRYAEWIFKNKVSVKELFSPSLFHVRYSRVKSDSGSEIIAKKKKISILYEYPRARITIIN